LLFCALNPETAMLKNNLKFILIILVLLTIGCAKRGNITGGLKDTLAPVLRYSNPKNFTTGFRGDEITLTFDEYIKLKDVNKQLIISPPMKIPPVISPSFASKVIKLKIMDTLQPNTTYSFNFGQSITDNNEGNPYNQFKYVFSTGTYIDSLTLGGRIKDAYDKTTDNFVSVMLYEVNDTFNDSVIYKENPRYITNTLDSLSTFRLENLKAGKYLLLALKDKNKNNKFNPKDDKIGFIKQPITIPNDTIFELELFKETLPLKALKPIQASGNRFLLPYEGKQNFKTSAPAIVLKNGDEVLETIITQFPKKDSLQIWHKPVKADSLSVEITKGDYNKNFSFRVKNQKPDTLSISAIQSGTLHLRDRFTLESTTPLVKFDKEKIKVISKDSTDIPFTTEYDEFEQKLYVDFKKEPSERYNLALLPGALTDFYEESNDTLSYSLGTRQLTDYGNLVLNLEKAKRFPLIVELTNKEGNIVKASEYSEGDTRIEFNNLEPSSYTVRIIYDDNKNKRYDSGNYLEKRYAEEVNYFQKEIDIRANWDVEQPIDLSIQYDPELARKEEIQKKKEGRKKSSSAF
jgi:uncharacterized protein (DUF2141 family)